MGKFIKTVIVAVAALLIVLVVFHWTRGADFGDGFTMMGNDLRVAIRYPNRPQTLLVFIQRPPTFDQALRLFSPLTGDWVAEIGRMSPDELDQMLNMLR